jgi:mRNA interferase MazF
VARGLSRGQVWLYRFAQPDKRRPVLVISRDDALEVMQTALVAGITTTIRGLATEVPLGPEHGMKSMCVINLDHIFTIRKADLRRYVTTLDGEQMRSVCRALGVATGCS